MEPLKKKKKSLWKWTIKTKQKWKTWETNFSLHTWKWPIQNKQNQFSSFIWLIKGVLKQIPAMVYGHNSIYGF